MRGYGQFCPVAQALEVLGERWTLLVVRELFSGSHRFNEIHRGVPLMSPTLLSQRLRRLQRAGIVERGPAGDYLLTGAGRELWPVVEGLGVWGQRWARAEIRREHLDPSMLMWDMRRRIDLDAIPARRTVIELRFRGVERGHAVWWLLLDRANVDVCLSDPGFGVDLLVDADLRTMIMVWMGDVPLTDALRAGRVVVTGTPALERAFPRWLRLSVLAGVERPGSAARPALGTG
ncbi:MAG TPA: helix-turn-helix domain-containing protein [Actinophytocola sp.]|jgi:DNA-binding HxlR family transcriptional regulator|uniref:winged helix-turn-helix transcriptional regulator n=1 Tax=Actinophytocola sp. TaxID=1872138 RepID=UPI002F93AA00